MAPILEVQRIQSYYGESHVLHGVSLAIETAQAVALLGRNGAGKTTTLRIVAGLLKPDAGSVRVMGHDVLASPEDAKRVLAFLPDDPLLYAKLRPMEYLEFVAGLWGLDPAAARDRAQRLLEWLGLADRTGEFIEGFSRGMRQKLALAGALIHEPRVMILDEPLTGLDAAAARQVKDLLVERARQGVCVILTTHILEIAERIAERISIIQRGRIVAQGTMAELRAEAGAGATLEDIFLEITREEAPGAVGG